MTLQRMFSCYGDYNFNIQGYIKDVENPSQHNSTLLAELAEVAEQICKTGDLGTIASATVCAVARLFSCHSVSFSAFDLLTFQPILDEHLHASATTHYMPRLERSHDLSASLSAGAEVITVADDQPDAYFVIYEPEMQPLSDSCELRIPFFVDPHGLCVLTLGKKESGTDYTADEINALRVLVSLLNRCCNRERADTAPPPEKISLADVEPYKRSETYSQILGQSQPIQSIQKLIAKIAPTDAAVLITGESGTGKELVARAIHQSSLRRNSPMVIVNCAALPENLVESELFGHERGAFTGALAQKKGKFEFAHQSTLFLDEIGDLSLAVQAKLLRVLQDGTFQRIGGQQSLYSDVRLLAATNKDLTGAIARGEFREDLYYRINVVQIAMPPLRDRTEDIPLLIHHYFNFYAQKYQKDFKGMHPQLLGWMRAYSFPGNIRELKNLVERAVIMGNDPAILPSLTRMASAMSLPASNNLTELERQHIRMILEQTGHNKSAAARQLGIARKTLREKIARYHIE